MLENNPFGELSMLFEHFSMHLHLALAYWHEFNTQLSITAYIIIQQFSLFLAYFVIAHAAYL